MKKTDIANAVQGAIGKGEAAARLVDVLVEIADASGVLEGKAKEEKPPKKKD
jgi:hypothetical protein